MTDLDPDTTFRGLPLTPEQDAEVRHYIKLQTQRGLPWDTPELSAMLKDMLQPPGDDNDGFDASAEETKAAAERAMGSVERRCLGCRAQLDTGGDIDANADTKHDWKVWRLG